MKNKRYWRYYLIICFLFTIEISSLGVSKFTHKNNDNLHYISLNKLTFQEKQVIYDNMLNNIIYMKPFFLEKNILNDNNMKQIIFNWFWIYGIPDHTSYAVYINHKLEGLICDDEINGIAIYLIPNNKISGRATAAMKLFFQYLSKTKQIQEKKALVLGENIKSLRLMWKTMEKYTIMYDNKLQNTIVKFTISKKNMKKYITSQNDIIETDNIKDIKEWEEFLSKIEYITK